MTIIKEGFERRWQKMPKRHTRQWYILMHEIMKNFKRAVVNVQLSNPDLTGLSWATRDFLKRLEDKKDVLDAMYVFGIGKVLYELQPWLLPWVKIAKAKVAKEFRAFLIEARQRRRNHLQYHGNINAPWFEFWSNEGWNNQVRYLSITGWTYKRFKEGGGRRYITSPVASRIRFGTVNRNDDCVIALCRNEEGRTVLGRIANAFSYINGKSWLFEKRFAPYKRSSHELNCVPHHTPKLQNVNLWQYVQDNPGSATLIPILCERHG